MPLLLLNKVLNICKSVRTVTSFHGNSMSTGIYIMFGTHHVGLIKYDAIYKGYGGIWRWPSHEMPMILDEPQGNMCLHYSSLDCWHVTRTVKVHHVTALEMYQLPITMYIKLKAN